jgi:hypothetical protein
VVAGVLAALIADSLGASGVVTLIARALRRTRLCEVMLRAWLKPQADRIDAVAQASWVGAIIEHMAKMGATRVAVHLRAAHDPTPIRLRSNVRGGGGFPKARPSRAGIELRGGGEQDCPAADAGVHAIR